MKIETFQTLLRTTGDKVTRSIPLPVKADAMLPNLAHRSGFNNVADFFRNILADRAPEIRPALGLPSIFDATTPAERAEQMAADLARIPRQQDLVPESYFTDGEAKKAIGI